MKFGKLTSLLVVAGFLAIASLQLPALSEMQNETSQEIAFVQTESIPAIDAGEPAPEWVASGIEATVEFVCQASAEEVVQALGSVSSNRRWASPPGGTQRWRCYQAEYPAGYLVPRGRAYYLAGISARSQGVLLQRIC